jgi:hypothetical protein
MPSQGCELVRGACAVAPACRPLALLCWRDGLVGRALRNCDRGGRPGVLETRDGRNQRFLSALFVCLPVFLSVCSIRVIGCQGAIRVMGCLNVTCVQCENGKPISPIDSDQPSMAHDADTDSDLARPPDGKRPSARHATPAMLLRSATRRRTAGHLLAHPGSCDSE